jgi:hypothetical protein
MEKKTKIIGVYSQVGHYMYPEDTWSESCEIDSEKLLLNWMKDLHKTSARNFNDYPFGGLFYPSMISFESQEYFIDDNGQVYNGATTDTIKPDYFDKVALEYKEWIKILEKDYQD